MSREKFGRLSSRIQARHEKEMLRQLRAIRQLHPAGKRILLRLMHNSENKTLHRNQPLYREGDPCDHVYIVRSGTFEMRKHTYADPQQIKAENGKGWEN